MARTTGAELLLWVALLGCAPKAPPAPAPAPAGDVVEEIDRIVQQQFYSEARLQEVGWRAEVERARAALGQAPDRAARTAVLQSLMASLRTSHTAYYPREDPAYWALASLFEKVLEKSCPRERVPAFPISRDDIGVFWKQVGPEWFAAGVFGGGPAEQGGLKVGDRVISAGGRPFSPVEAFAGQAGREVALEVQRAREGPPLQLRVTPRPTRPQDEFRQATADSFRMIEHRGRRFGYLHVWIWATLEAQAGVLDAISKANAAGADGFIIDIRDGWGGADPSFLGMFFRDAPVLESVARDGKAQRWDKQLRAPSALLINGGTRSGKEVFAYGAKKHGLMALVGERTAGAVTFGRPFCLSDGALLWLAVMDARVDGERLEGRGVEPDVAVPFDVRYAAGEDVQLQRAVEVLATRGTSATGR
ncbi:MAG TPA: S41 family peptidase [Myxococcales bacterium]|nr:S41 family peptidase [Myxococcales bacterium]